MRPLDWIVLVTSLVSIVAYGLYRSRGSNTVDRYLLAGRSMPWYAMALSIMATQASAITFISTTGQSYVDGMRFVQFYFGLPIAMVVICATVVPIFHRAKVYTAYEYLEKRFDGKTRTLASVIFLCQRGLSAGLTIYAPAIVLSMILGWPERVTTFLMGATVVTYTVIGGIKAVTWSDVQQMCIIFLGLVVALVTVIVLLPTSVSFGDAVYLAGAAGRLNAVTTDFRLERPLQHLERPVRRHVSVPFVFRLRPVAGAALSDRPLHRAEPPGPAVQRRGQDPHAVLHSVHRRHGVRVLPVRTAAGAVPARRTGAHPGDRAISSPCRRNTTRRSSTGARRRWRWWRRTTRAMPRPQSRRWREYRTAQQEIDDARARAASLVERTRRRKGLQRHQLHLPFVRDALSAGWDCGTGDRRDFRGHHVGQFGGDQFAGHGDGGGSLPAPHPAGRRRPSLPAGIALGHAVLGRVRGGVRRMGQAAGVADRGGQRGGLAVLRLAAGLLRAGVRFPRVRGTATFVGMLAGEAAIFWAFFFTGTSRGCGTT